MITFYHRSQPGGGVGRVRMSDKGNVRGVEMVDDDDDQTGAHQQYTDDDDDDSLCFSYSRLWF